ncbi:hypothetical protein L798_14395 [Zootermopsis nevadensis]|uniref:Uncharacterized protein n=1 Tax=Zootermopsis nevadensis TaxID=136037 RepID=A0A067QYB8_ZOONE|nr:hypothetical protein L798_14395 [Zootermopsis nevadensis]
MVFYRGAGECPTKTTEYNTPSSLTKVTFRENVANDKAEMHEVTILWVIKWGEDGPLSRPGRGGEEKMSATARNGIPVLQPTAQQNPRTLVPSNMKIFADDLFAVLLSPEISLTRRYAHVV